MSQPELMRGSQGYRLSDAAKEQAAHTLMDPATRPSNVVGFGQGVKWTHGEPTGEPALLVFVSQKLPPTMLREQDLLPRRMDDGTTVDVVRVGHVVAERLMGSPQAMSAPAAQFMGAPAPAIPRGDGAPADTGVQVLTRRMRPCPSGFSIGNVQVTAGTMGSVVYDFLPGATIDPPAPGLGIPSRFYVLSNNHVLADSNRAPVGSAIVQPGRFDGGVDPQDRIAVLSRFIPIDLTPAIPLTSHNNIVDAAIGEVQFQEATRETYFNGAPRGWRRKANVSVGDLVKKTGRTTNLTLGRIIAVDATIDVSYGFGVGRFRDQIVTTAMSAGGDSGSLVTSLDNVAMGLLFAGSVQVTIVNHIEHVRSLLRVEIAETLA
ncbi:chymotrypsin family serine protease [Nonomuraea turcica]|uniref:hypothetical protein n=1 Tax=Nonomuraea sp. G32 TaxID=3067274 RepID=UPI00273CA738|nr:hypothetical protein [Nonomuraea sp. G32]MDP4509471.1 hypothetical protein [Nonomuraea sp. G32]